MAIAHRKIIGQKLSERQLEMVRLMTSRGLLHRKIDEDKSVYYIANGLPDLWRW